MTNKELLKLWDEAVRLSRMNIWLPSAWHRAVFIKSELATNGMRWPNDIGAGG